MSLISSLSDKQINSFNNSDARINIFEGSVRAGKSFICLLRWLEFCRNGPDGPLIIVGRTDKTIKRNIINPMADLVGDSVRYSVGKGEVQLYNRTMYVVGANDDRAEAKIRGSEFAGALIDELTLIPENFVKMLLSRLSIPGAKLFASTNPDSPFHWAKTDFIDREKELNCKVFSFTIDDNPSLDEEYKAELRREYQGLWYKRFIEGKWVMAEGAVYDFFDEEVNVIQMPKDVANYYIVGVDYGTTNPCVFTLIGYNPSSYPNMWLEKEYYYNSKDTMRQKSDYEYANDLIEFIDGYNVDSIYIDPSAASFRQELRRNDVSNVKEAKNDVLPGIRYVGQLLTNGTLKICSNCKNTIKEFTNYVWDSKASARGEDKPIKQNDHCFVAGTPVLTDKGYLPIEQVKKGESVLTRCGYRKVKDTFVHKDKAFKYNVLGKDITCTPSHKFLTLGGWKEISSMIQSDILFTVFEELPWLKLSYLKESNTDAIQSLQTLVTELTSVPIRPTLSKDMDISIEMFGSRTMERYHKDVIFITKTEIPSTTTLAISNVFQLVSTYPIMEQLLVRSVEKLEDGTWMKSEGLQRHGTPVKMVGSGTESMPRSLSNFQKESLTANSVTKNSQQLNSPTPSFVQISASLDGEELVTLIMRIDAAFNAKKSLKLISTQNANVALLPVQQSEDGMTDVYNIHVEDEHEYFVDGILVSNCMDALRYGLYTHFFERTGKRMEESEADMMQRLWANKV